MELGAIGNAASSAQRPASAIEPHPAAGKTTATAAASSDAAKPGSAPADLKKVNEAVRDINKAMQALSRDIEFSVDTDSKRTVVKVIDQHTKEVIRQMPTEEALEIGKALEKVQGLLIRQSA
ncbi:flagellar protein FlaG [Janthinobacterium fluminis]|uniref:Flagellar protein FlaG n=1 Tax=Janthinobacterium fluminis TaxID=2987524 RepID=A0ABT5K4E5_9BURK|nr:flagellar protein FlaG [Janthinobacterium fluminis]MDC8759298.1 flagellar protein FlaG [Janthinobacterium fluminis]